MSNDLTKRTDPTKPERQKSNDTASRLKRELMADALDRLFGTSRLMHLTRQASARHPRARRPRPSPGWSRGKSCSERYSRRRPAAI